MLLLVKLQVEALSQRAALKILQGFLTLKYLVCKSSAIFQPTYAKNMVQWIMKVCLYVIGSELLPDFGHLSFCLIHNETGFPQYLKIRQWFQCFFCYTEVVSLLLLHYLKICLKTIWYVKADSVGGSASGLTKDFALNKLLLA